MPAEAAVDLLRLFEGAGIDVWLDGGWAVDAALGEQTPFLNLVANAASCS